MEKSVGGFGARKQFGRGGGFKELPDRVGSGAGCGRQGRPGPETRRGNEGTAEFAGGKTTQAIGPSENVPGVAAGISDHAQVWAIRSVGDKGEAAVAVDGAGREQGPGAERHRHGPDPENGPGAFAESEGADAVDLQAGQALDGAEDRDVGLVVQLDPLRRFAGAQPADLDAGGGGIEHQERAVLGKQGREARHGGDETARAGAAQARRRRPAFPGFGATTRRSAVAESVIDRHPARPSLDNSFNTKPVLESAVNVQLNNVSATRKSLVVTLDASEVDAEHLAVVGEIAKMARIPGFRPGKAPTAMIAKRFAKEIAEEFKQKVVAKAYRSGLEQQKLEVISIVNVEEGTIAAGASATVTITLDVRPEFALPDYQNLSTEIVPTDASDDEVAKVIEGLRGEAADFKAADRPAQKGDYVKLAYEGKVGEQPIAELVPDKALYGKVPQTWEEVEGTNEGVIPGLGKQLAGLKPGDKKDVTIEFPAEFAAAPALAGKSAVYAVDVQEIRERVLPELNAEFFKTQQVDDLAGLQAKVRNNLKAQKEYQNRSAQRRQVTEQLAAAVDFPVPDSMVEGETQGVLRQFIEENMRRGVPAEQFEKDKKELFEGAKKAAFNRVKLQLILARIAEQEKIEVTNDDLNEFLYREAMRTGQKPDKFAKTLANDREQLRSVQQSIIFDKAVDFLVAKAKVATVEPKA